MTTGIALLTIAAVSLLGFTAATLADAEGERRRLKAAGVNGSRKRYAHRVIRHEVVRLTKHLLITAMIIATAYDVPDLLEWRNAGIIAVAFLIGMNSLLDLIDRHRGYQGYLREKNSRED